VARLTKEAPSSLSAHRQLSEVTGGRLAAGRPLRQQPLAETGDDRISLDNGVCVPRTPVHLRRSTGHPHCGGDRCRPSPTCTMPAVLHVVAHDSTAVRGSASVDHHGTQVAMRRTAPCCAAGRPASRRISGGPHLLPCAGRLVACACPPISGCSAWPTIAVGTASGSQRTGHDPLPRTCSPNAAWPGGGADHDGAPPGHPAARQSRTRPSCRVAGHLLFPPPSWWPSPSFCGGHTHEDPGPTGPTGAGGHRLYAYGRRAVCDAGHGMGVRLRLFSVLWTSIAFLLSVLLPLLERRHRLFGQVGAAVFSCQLAGKLGDPFRWCPRSGLTQLGRLERSGRSCGCQGGGAHPPRVMAEIVRSTPHRATFSDTGSSWNRYRVWFQAMLVWVGRRTIVPVGVGRWYSLFCKVHDGLLDIQTRTEEMHRSSA